MGQSPTAPADETATYASRRLMITAIVFGLAAFLTVKAGLTIPIVGTAVVTDPREVFTTIGAGLTGPVGGLLIGLLAGVAEPEIPLASLLAHVAGCLWMGVAYKVLVYQRMSMPWLLAGWAAIVLICYYVFFIPGFVVGQALFYPSALEPGGDAIRLASAYAALARGAMPEAVLTTVLTTLVILALPRRNRAPLW